jgi:restriction endonuclease S subunit
MESFLQNEPYYSGRDLFYLKPKIKLSDKQLLYYCLCLKANKYKFNYGRQANTTLPSLDIPSLDEIPEWVSKTPMPNIPKSLSVTKQFYLLNVSDWKQFVFDDLFEIKRGESGYKVDLQRGNIPYVSATEKNNGVSYFVKNSNNAGNVITLSYDGTIGEAFYQKREFFASEKIAVLSLKNKMLNPFLAMFLITVIRLEKFRFNYGYKWSVESRMKKTKIKLPSDSDGHPDWEFMENYIESLPYSSNLLN